MLAFGAVAAGAALFLWPAMPRAQRVRMHLGVGSTRVISVRARLADPLRTTGWDRESMFQFPSGAPPSFDWTFDQENGKVRVEVELHTVNSTADGKWEILLAGGETVLELSDMMRGLS